MMSLTIACTEIGGVHCLICLHRSDRNTSGVNVWRWPLLFIQWLTMQRYVPVVVCLWAGRCCLAPVGRTVCSRRFIVMAIVSVGQTAIHREQWVGQFCRIESTIAKLV